MEAAAKESIILSSSIFGKTRSRYDCTIAYNVTRFREGRTDSKPSANVLTFFLPKFKLVLRTGGCFEIITSTHLFMMLLHAYDLSWHNVSKNSITYNHLTSHTIFRLFKTSF